MAASQPHFASASLYVGDLHRDVTEAMLYEVFNSIGPVASIRVCRDSSTRSSLGYAYVNYHSVCDAERALDTLNYTHIKNVPCRLMWSHRDPSLRKSGAGNIFVKNLDKDIDNKALYDTFSLFGNILSCKVAQDEFGKSRGFGFVHYETEEAANTSIERVNAMKIGAKTVFVGHFQKSSERTSYMEEKYTNVYVKNVPIDWTEERVKECFAECGEVTSVVLQTDLRGRTFGFVNFADADCAKLAVNSLHQKKVTESAENELNKSEKKEDGASPDTKETTEVVKDGNSKPKATPEEKGPAVGEEKDGGGTSPESADRPGSSGRLSVERGGEDTSRLYVSRFQPRAERVALLKSKFDRSTEQRHRLVGVNLYIKNIHDSVDDAMLRELFESFGTITSAKVMVDEESGLSRGFGFVGYLFPDEATKAVTEMHLKLVEGKPLYVGLHEKREDRVTRLQQRSRLPNVRTRMPAGLQSQIQFGAPSSMFFAQGMQQGGGHPTYPVSGQNRAGVPAGYPMGGMMQWSRGQAQPIRGGGYASGPHGGAMVGGGPQGGNQIGVGGYPPVSPSGLGAQQNGATSPIGGIHDALSVNPDYLNTAPQVHKQILGERLFPLIQRLQPSLAGKITGMMLDMDNSELVTLLESESQLRSKVDEALRVLHQAQGPLPTMQPANEQQGSAMAVNQAP